ncbi:ankyrin repeat-containing domain protein [Mycena capillaripes]|nr:ankyrin repeat-containing domain protein [Mycena capillaripes]
MTSQASESCTVNQHIYGGKGGNGGAGGGSGGRGEGPKVTFGDIQANQFTVNHHTHGSGPEQRQRMDSEERTKIIDWFSPINFFLRHAEIARARQTGTGEWLLAEPYFQEWESGSERILWCRGIRTSMVVDHLRARAKSQKEHIGVACIYLNHKEAGTQTPDKLLSGIWSQLVRDKDVGTLAKEIYEEHLKERTPPSTEEVVQVLRSSLPHFSKIYLIVDAVDEYPEDKRWILLRHLAEMCNNVDLMITSRPHILPQSTSFHTFETLDIRPTEEDLRRYVEGQIDSSPRLSKHVHKQPSLREDIHLKINDHTVDGMQLTNIIARFLLAKLHIESLSTKNTITAVREALKNLPKNLHDSYDIAMQRIKAQNDEDQTTAHSVLTWVANAKRPLSVSEITVALAIEPGARQLDEENSLDIEIILAVCAGLVIVDEELDVVRLVHYTTQEYLDSIKAEQFPNAQTEITRTLLTFLTFDGFPEPSWKFWKLPPLLEYSQYSLAHAAGKPEGFLRCAPQWKQTMEEAWESPPWDFPVWPSQPSALWIAAAANLLDIAKFLLEAEPMNKHPDGSGISIASYYGHFEMVRLLVENGADVNTPIKRYGTPLTAASEAGHDAIVRLLLKNGADANVHSRLYGFVLHAALAKKQEKIAQLLIENGADVNLQGPHGSALTTASWYGTENIVSLLLKRGVEINVRGGLHDLALHTAVAKKHEKIARLLIENGADVNLQGEHGGALTTASWHGMKNIVSLLLERGADVNACCQRYGFALHIGFYKKHEEIVRLLIQNGADVNSQREHGGALTTASWYGMENIVVLLLEQGADINARGGPYDFALHTALAKKHGRIARLLIENGADVNLEGEHGAALSTASWYGMEDMVILLLDRGVNVNARSRAYDFALHTALASGHGEIARLLIENGADVNLQGVYGGALATASRYGVENIVFMLLQQGADVNAPAGRYSSALHAAIASRREKVVQMLIEHGARVDDQIAHLTDREQGPPALLGQWLGFSGQVASGAEHSAGLISLETRFGSCVDSELASNGYTCVNCIDDLVRGTDPNPVQMGCSFGMVNDFLENAVTARNQKCRANETIRFDVPEYNAVEIPNGAVPPDKHAPDIEARVEAEYLKILLSWIFVWLDLLSQGFSTCILTLRSGIQEDLSSDSVLGAYDELVEPYEAVDDPADFCEQEDIKSRSETIPPLHSESDAQDKKGSGSSRVKGSAQLKGSA